MHNGLGMGANVLSSQYCRDRSMCSRPAWSTWRVPVSHSETIDGLLMIKPAAPGCSVLSDMSREMGLWGSVGCPSALGSNWTG